MTTSPLSSSAAVPVWDLPLRIFHWLLVAAISVAFLSAFGKSALSPWHQTAGWIAAILIAFRLVWGVVGGEYARFSNFLRFGDLGHHLAELSKRRAKPSLGHNPLGAIAIVGLLSMIALSVVTGALLQGGGEEDTHELVAYALLALIGIHVAAVVVMSIVTRENLAKAMVTGRKAAALHPGAIGAKPPTAFALVMTVLAMAVSAYGVVRIDPGGFGPHYESERGETAGGSGLKADRE
jgi:cytochrome b